MASCTCRSGVFSGDGLGGISHRIKQGGHQDDGAAAAALVIYVKTDLTQGERIGQGSELLRAPGRCVLARLFPADMDVPCPSVATTEVGVSGLMQSHEAIAPRPRA
jgi:hypothetical protein